MEQRHKDKQCQNRNREDTIKWQIYVIIKIECSKLVEKYNKTRLGIVQDAEI